VVAAQDQRSHAILETLEDRFGGSRAGFGYLVEESGVGVTGLLGFGDFDKDVTAVGHPMPQRGKARLQAGDTDCRRTHIDASAGGAQIEWNAEDADSPGGERLCAAVAIFGWKGGVSDYLWNLNLGAFACHGTPLLWCVNHPGIFFAERKTADAPTGY
jgi:hypothetical protein